MRAGFQIDIKGGFLRSFPGPLECNDFGMSLSCSCMVSFPNHFAIFYQNGADEGIRGSSTPPFLCEAEYFPHPVFIVHTSNKSPSPRPLPSGERGPKEKKPSFRRRPESSLFKFLWVPPYRVRGRLLKSGMTGAK